MLLLQISDVCHAESRDDQNNGCSVKGRVAFAIHHELVKFGEAAGRDRSMMFDLASWLGEFLFWRAGVVFNDLQVERKLK